LAIINAVFLIGFLGLWFGLLAIWLAMAIHFVPGYRSMFCQPLTQSERSAKALQTLNAALIHSAKSRLGRLGQLLMATGLSLLMATGIAWLILRTLERHAP